MSDADTGPEEIGVAFELAELAIMVVIAPCRSNQKILRKDCGFATMIRQVQPMEDSQLAVLIQALEQTGSASAQNRLSLRGISMPRCS